MTSDFAIAVHALVYLNHEAHTVSSDALARSVCTNPARVRKVMAKLKRAGLVGTKEGAEGGYYFELDSARVNLRMVDDALMEPFVCSSWRSGSHDLQCLVASGMADVLDEIYTRLNMRCRDELATITIRSIHDRIFNKVTKI